MTDRIQPPRPEPTPEGPGTNAHSIARRREILKHIGRASAAAGVASPLAALADTSGYVTDASGTKFSASISGVQSVLHSARLTGTENSGKGPAYYSSSSKIPNGANSNTFGQYFNVSGTDSLGNGPNHADNIYKQKFFKICQMSPLPVEAHWAAAYCNAVNGFNKVPSTFPYSPSQVAAHFTAPGDLKTAAYLFYTTYLEHG